MIKEILVENPPNHRASLAVDLTWPFEKGVHTIESLTSLINSGEGPVAEEVLMAETTGVYTL